MKIEHVAVVALLAFSFASSACASQPEATTQQSLKIKTGGGVTGPFISLTLSSSGDLLVARESMPFTDTGLTVTQYRAHVAVHEATRLFELARSASDFGQACDVVGHGTSARLWLDLDDQRVEYKCDGVIVWPTGPLTKTLVDSLNRYLPEKFQVK